MGLLLSGTLLITTITTVKLIETFCEHVHGWWEIISLYHHILLLKNRSLNWMNI